MFGRRYYGGRYYGARYWGDGGLPPAPSAFNASQTSVAIGIRIGSLVALLMGGPRAWT